MHRQRGADGAHMGPPFKFSPPNKPRHAETQPAGDPREAKLTVTLKGLRGMFSPPKRT